MNASLIAMLSYADLFKYNVIMKHFSWKLVSSPQVKWGSHLLSWLAPRKNL
jgi:hypothetical protein